MKNKQVTKYQINKSQPSPLMTEAVRSLIKEWVEQDRLRKTKIKVSIEVPVSQLMP
jgi:hypothetical protein